MSSKALNKDIIKAKKNQRNQRNQKIIAKSKRLWRLFFMIDKLRLLNNKSSKEGLNHSTSQNLPQKWRVFTRRQHGVFADLP